MDHVNVDRHEGVAVVKLVDRERRNAMTARMVAEIVDTFDTLESDVGVGAVVITGEAPAFCSGADVAALGSLSEGQNDTERRAIGSIYEGFLRVLRSPLPTVAAVNGPAVGAGLNLGARVRRPHRRAIGALRHPLPAHRPAPGGGHAWMLERAVGPQSAAAMMLFGAPVDGPRAVEIGLAWACHPDDELLGAAITFAARAASVPRELTAAAGATLREVPWQPDFEAAIATEITRQSWSLGQGWFRPRKNN